MMGPKIVGALVLQNLGLCISSCDSSSDSRSGSGSGGSSRGIAQAGHTCAAATHGDGGQLQSLSGGGPCHFYRLYQAMCAHST